MMWCMLSDKCWCVVGFQFSVWSLRAPVMLFLSCSVFHRQPDGSGRILVVLLVWVVVFAGKSCNR